MKVLVTGSSGFIGFNLCQKLLHKGYQITGIDNLNNYYDVNLKIERLKILKSKENFLNYSCNINNLDHNILGDFDVAINLAAQAGVRLPERQNYKYVDSNVLGFSAFLEFCRKKNIKNIIYASSSSVYSGNENSFFLEEEKLAEPKSFYAKTKIYNEEQASKFAKKNDSKIIGLRFFTVYGPFGRPDMAYYNFTNQILSRKKITIFNHGNTYRDMTYIDDVCDGIENAICSIKNIKGHELFNIGNENPIHTMKLVSSIENEFKLKAKIENVTNNREINKTYANCEKSRKILRYNPSTSFEEGIKFFFNWYKEFYKL